MSDRIPDIGRFLRRDLYHNWILETLLWREQLQRLIELDRYLKIERGSGPVENLPARLAS